MGRKWALGRVKVVKVVVPMWQWNLWNEFLLVNFLQTLTSWPWKWSRDDDNDAHAHGHTQRYAA